MTHERETAKFAAVVLAAGLSSRMGSPKPLLPLGRMTALERVTGSLRAAGVRDIVVVTGHARQEVAAEVERLGLREAHNPAYEQGMFTSVQTGSRSLSGDVDAFFILPVDCPLVAPQVMRELISTYRTGKDVLYPTCCDRRGHPPLISGRLRAAIDAADPGDNLRSLLKKQAVERSLEVTDATILLDMDTIYDYRRLQVFAAALDGKGAGAQPGLEPVLTESDAQYLLAALEVEERVIKHCRAVASVAERVATALNAAGDRLDLPLVRAAALLHDLAKGTRKHAADGETILARLGFPRLGAVVGAHMVLPETATGGVVPATLDESQIVYLADKLVVEDRPGGVAARREYALRRYGRDEAAVTRIERRIQEAALIAARVERATGRTLEEILAERETRIYLLRHARPRFRDEEWRFIGSRSDPPLGPEGIAQAKKVAARLKTVPFAEVWSSGLRRSLQTAQVVSGIPEKEIHTEPRLQEVDLGLWDGFSKEEIMTRYPEEWTERERSVIVEHRFPQGESFAELQERAVTGFLDIVSAALRNGANDILMVSHKSTNRAMLCHFLGLDLDQMFTIGQEYCALSILRARSAGDGFMEITVEEMST